MKKTYTKYLYPVALFLAFAVGSASAQQQSGPAPQDQLSPAEIDDLIFMRAEEKLARDSYMVLGEKWGLAIFSSISKSEQRHMDALKLLLDKFDITDPVEDETDVGNFVDPKLQTLFDDLMVWGLLSEIDGLKVGGAIEETDILDIQHAIERTENADITATYESLVCGSRNHLRAFIGQLELNGEVYEPILMSQEEISAIVDFPVERNCGLNQRGKGKNQKGKGKNPPGKGKNGR